MDSVSYNLHPSVRIDIKGKIIEKRRSKYQDITVLDSERLGRILLLGEGDYAVTQFSEKDEAYYHEAIVHPTMSLHPDPKKVLVIGGGDGGTAREVLRYPVEQVIMAELDEDVIDVSRKFFPSISNGAFDDPRLKLHVGDGRKYVEETPEKFDVIIMDLTDAEGPSKMLFTKEFYQSVKSKMTEGGVLSVQTGSPVFDPVQNGRISVTLREVFKNTASYANFIHSFFIMESYVVATDAPIAGIRANLEKRGIGLTAYTPEQLEFMVMNPPPVIKENIKKGWNVSTDADPVDILKHNSQKGQ